jgi:hypothetical protein
VVGWDVEPTYQAEKNAATIRMSQAGSDPAVPVQGAEKTLKIQIRRGAQTGDIVPTRVGDYTWTFVGSINGDQINEKFDSADGKFDSVQPPTALEFPLALPDPAQTGVAGVAGWITRAGLTMARSANGAPPERVVIRARR